MAGAVIALIVRNKYEKTEALRGVWHHFALALWMWFAAETIWAVYNMLYGEVGITIADLFWVIADMFLLRSLFLQYTIVFQSGAKEFRNRALLWLFGLIVLLLIFGQILVVITDESWNLTLVVSAFYPAVDLIIGVAALRLAYRFRRGALGYPWMGLFVFAIADMFYAWLDLSGVYAWSLDQGNLLTTISDVSYNAAYLVVALGCYTHLLLLKHGPIFNTSSK